MSTFKQLKVTSPAGAVNYVPTVNKGYLERRNEMLKQNGKHNEIFKIEEVVFKSEEEMVNTITNHEAFDESHISPANASEKLASVSSENEDLKKRIAELEAAAKTTATTKPEVKEAAKETKEATQAAAKTTVTTK